MKIKRLKIMKQDISNNRQIRKRLTLIEQSRENRQNFKFALPGIYAFINQFGWNYKIRHYEN